MSGFINADLETSQRLFEACEHNERFKEDLEDMEFRAADTAMLQLGEDLHTTALISLLSPLDNCVVISLAHGVLAVVCVVQAVVTLALQTHVQTALSFTSPRSVVAHRIRELYSKLLDQGRLDYMRLEETDVTEICGDFHFTVEESGTPGTRWSAFFKYDKLPVDNWYVSDIGVFQRSMLDDARYILENTWYMYIFMIVEATWILTLLHELRNCFVYMWACSRTEVLAPEDGQPLVREGALFKIRGLTMVAKITSLACGVYRLLIAAALGYVGCLFLMWTTSPIDLLLESLTLIFVLELGRITYKATVSRARQHLISNLKPLTVQDPTNIRAVLDARKWIHTTVAVTIAFVGSFCLRQWQVAGYMEKFRLTAGVCLFQGPTPGYWSSYDATFPAAGFCESLLQLRCEASVVGEKGSACFQDPDQLLCKFYTPSNVAHSTWSSIDWDTAGPCVAIVNGEAYRVEDLRFEGDRTRSILGRACQAMWQRVPTVNFRNRTLEGTGPRTRVYPYRKYVPAAPFWCPLESGADRVLGGDGSLQELEKRLTKCAPRTLVYTTRHAGVVLDKAGAEAIDDAEREPEGDEEADLVDLPTR